jgi:iron complex outermembrane recepter protein
MPKVYFLCVAAVLMQLPGLTQVSQDPVNITFNPDNIFSVFASLSGRVTDAKSGEPLPGASIYISDLKTGAIADASGRFYFRELPAGHHLVEISYTGYTSIVEHIDIENNLEKNFSLQPAILENQQVIVTGVSQATGKRKAPVPVTVIRKTDFLQTASANIIDGLAKQPGISQLSTGPGISKPVIRGLGYNRVLVINEGVRQEGQQWGDEHGIEIDELSISKAEILKGPASLMYGSDALAGVINLITHVPVPEGTLQGNLLTNYQSNNRLWALHSNIAGNKKGINWNLYGTLKSAGDYQNKYDGRVLNSRFHEKNTGGYIGVNKKWGFSHLVVSYFNQQTGLVEGDRDPASGQFLLYSGTSLQRVATAADLEERSPFIPNQKIGHFKVASDNNISLGKSRLKLNLGFQDNQRKEFGNPEEPQAAELWFDLKTITYNVQVSLPGEKEWHTSVGINGMYQNNLNKGEEAIIPDYHFFDAGGFVYVQRFFDRSTISGGLRFDNRSVKGKEMAEGNDIKFESFSQSYSNVSGSIGVSFEPSENISLKTNFARGFRAPTLAELASNGAHEGTNRYEYGDRNLKSETSRQWDGGMQMDYEHFSLGWSLFYNRVNNFIFYRKLESVSGGDSLVQVDGEDLQAFRFQQYRATLRGMEMSFDFHPHPLDWLHFENSISFVRGRFNEMIDDTRNLPQIPPARWQSELRVAFKKSGHACRNAYLRLGVEKNFSQNKPFTAYQTETHTPGYMLLNAGAGADIVNKKNQTILSIHLAGINLTNTVYQSHLSRLKYTDVNEVTGRAGVFNTGRNFSVKVNVPLHFVH